MRPLSRRTLLRGAGTSLALPFLQAMAPRHARAAVAPKRLIVFFTPNGYIRDAWTPTGTETEFTLSRILAPLEPLKSELIVLDGIDNVAATKGPGDDHMRGMGSMLTGVELLPGKTIGGGGTPSGYASGPSVDQEIIRRTKPFTRFPSLELGVKSGSQGTVWGYSNYKAANQPLPLDNNPASVFERMFGDVGVDANDDSLLLKRRAQRRSVLDAVQANFRLFNARLGRDDRARFEQHVTTVRELEERLLAAKPPGLSPLCKRPAAPMKLDFNANDLFPEVGKLQMDLLVQALSCDLTRVATLQWQNSVGGVRFSWLGATRGHHDLSHDPDTNLETKEMLTKINVWFAEQLAYLALKLKATPAEDGGSLLDHTVILWCNELSMGNLHSHPDMPYLLLGRAGGRLRTGRYLRYEKNTTNDLLTSLLQIFDVPVQTFGNPLYNTGPLVGLL